MIDRCKAYVEAGAEIIFPEALKDEKLRLFAEMENLRKRMEKDKIDSIKYGSANLARDILTSSDNLARALDNLSEEENKTQLINNFIDGLKIIQKELISILEKHGVKKIEPMHKKLDHEYHQAMLEVEDNTKEPGTVVQEIQKGYMLSLIHI